MSTPAGLPGWGPRLPALPAPIQRTPGRPWGGNVPQSENVISKDETDLVARATASETL